MNDQELLSAYVAAKSAEAFAAIVRANTGIVYAAARRQLGDSHLAEDVTQAVFILLMQKADRVKGSLAGWLILATRYACRDAIKLARRRGIHERRAAAMNANTMQAPPADWQAYTPHLDAAMSTLRRRDRDAIALHFFCGLTVREVGESMGGLTQAAAEKRISRALDRLRAILVTNTTAPSVAVMATQLAAHGSEAAPASLVHSIIAAPAAGKGLLAGMIARKAGLAMIRAKLLGAAAAGLVLAIVLSGAGAAWEISERNSSATTSSMAPRPAAALPAPPSPRNRPKPCAQVEFAWRATAFC